MASMIPRAGSRAIPALTRDLKDHFVLFEALDVSAGNRELHTKVVTQLRNREDRPCEQVVDHLERWGRPTRLVTGPNFVMQFLEAADP